MSLFKYISCYCLSGYGFSKNKFFKIQIHLMLLFIRDRRLHRGRPGRFKYSSCSGLSLRSMFCRYRTQDSNTSHVIVYQEHLVVPDPLREFKYISCYCLSDRVPICPGRVGIQIHLMLLFIQIAAQKQRVKMNSNTSHVIVYPA